MSPKLPTEMTASRVSSMATSRARSLAVENLVGPVVLASRCCSDLEAGAGCLHHVKLKYLVGASTAPGLGCLRSPEAGREEQ